jgi:two-component system, NarL family, sensor kinase
MPISRAEVIFILSIISLFILIMVTFIIIILFFMKKKQKGFTSDLYAVKENYDKELYKAQLEIQEQTFEEISREIHDNVGQLLAMAKLGLNNLDFGEKEAAIKGASEISGILDSALEDLRYMSRAMNAEFIKKRGLLKSIEMQVEFLQRNAYFKTHLHVNGSYNRLSVTKEIILFRILQEAVNNIIRHSGATEIHISLNYHSECLILSIGDNGKGFSREEKLAVNSLSNGISNMQYRAQLIDAGFEINSEIEKGTTIHVNVNY